MPNIFIFHGVQGHPKENWIPWVKKELERRGHKVFVPQFPTPEGQTLDNWMTVLDEYSDRLTPDSILIGHSLGVPFALNVIERYKVKAAFLVAGFYGKAGNEFDDGMKSFAQREFDWSKIKNNCGRFVVFHSDNDPYIPLKKGEELAEKLGVPVTLVKGAGHFNEGSGWMEFEEGVGII